MADRTGLTNAQWRMLRFLETVNRPYANVKPGQVAMLRTLEERGLVTRGSISNLRPQWSLTAAGRATLSAEATATGTPPMSTNRIGMADPILPIVQGDWVGREAGGDFEVARVRQAYYEDGMVYADLVPYNLEGENIGRQSPPEGGPKAFEPWCQITDNGWRRIERPKFPLRRYVVGTPDPDKPGWNALRLTIFHGGKGSATPKADRTKLRKQSRDNVRRTVLVVPAPPSNAPDVETAALRRSAQELRDQARFLGGPAAMSLRHRADTLEAEAAQLETKL